MMAKVTKSRGLTVSNARVKRGGATVRASGVVGAVATPDAGLEAATVEASTAKVSAVTGAKKRPAKKRAKKSAKKSSGSGDG
jgi:hypothetical protein